MGNWPNHQYFNLPFFYRQQYELVGDSTSRYVIGVDFGTDSVRALLVEVESGKELHTEVCHYPRWKDGLYCDPETNQFRQHPLDYIEGLEKSITTLLREV